MTKIKADAQLDSLEEFRQRAERAEQELRELKQKTSPTSQSEDDRDADTSFRKPQQKASGGAEDLRGDPMMAHLMDALNEGKDIGHYGRLVFTMVALHFLPEDDVAEWLSKDRDVDHEKSMTLIRQVQLRDYNPPRRQRILEWQTQQEFPILPDPQDPDCGNVYKSLKFPDEVYEHIQHYQAEKLDTEEPAA